MRTKLLGKFLGNVVADVGCPADISPALFLRNLNQLRHQRRSNPLLAVAETRFDIHLAYPHQLAFIGKIGRRIQSHAHGLPLDLGNNYRRPGRFSEQVFFQSFGVFENRIGTFFRNSRADEKLSAYSSIIII